MIKATEAVLIAKLIRNTPMAPTSKEIFVREMIKIIESDHPGFRKTRFREIALSRGELDKHMKHFISIKENRIGIQYPD